MTNRHNNFLQLISAAFARKKFVSFALIGRSIEVRDLMPPVVLPHLFGWQRNSDVIYRDGDGSFRQRNERLEKTFFSIPAKLLSNIKMISALGTKLNKKPSDKDFWPVEQLA